MSTEQWGVKGNWNEIDEIVKKLQGIAALLRYRWGTCYVPGILRGVLRVLRVHDPWILRWFSSSSAFKKRPMGTRYSISQCAGTQNAQSWFRAKWKQKVTSKTHESFWEILRVFVIYVKKNVITCSSSGQKQANRTYELINPELQLGSRTSWISNVFGRDKSYHLGVASRPITCS